MVRRVGTGRGVIDEEWLIGLDRLLLTNPTDRLIGHVFSEVIPIFLRCIDNGDTIVDGGFPHVVFGADKAVELFKALTRGPTGLRTSCSGLTARCFMPFTKGSCVVSVKPQDFCNRHRIVRHHSGVTGITRCNLWDGTGVDFVVITAGFQRCPGRCAEGCGVEFVVTKSILGKFLSGRHVHHTAKGRGRCIANIIKQDDHHIGGISWCCDLPLGRHRHL